MAGGSLRVQEARWTLRCLAQGLTNQVEGNDANLCTNTAQSGTLVVWYGRHDKPCWLHCCWATMHAAAGLGMPFKQMLMAAVRCLDMQSTVLHNMAAEGGRDHVHS